VRELLNSQSPRDSALAIQGRCPAPPRHSTAEMKAYIEESTRDNIFFLRHFEGAAPRPAQVPQETRDGRATKSLAVSFFPSSFANGGRSFALSHLLLVHDDELITSFADFLEHALLTARMSSILGA